MKKESRRVCSICGNQFSGAMGFCPVCMFRKALVGAVETEEAPSMLLYSALTRQFQYSLVTDKLTATMQIAQRVYSLAQEQNDSALMIGANRCLAVTFYYLGDFESARRHAKQGIQIWRSGGVQSRVEEVTAPAVTCLVYEALCEWHFGEISSCKASMVEGIALAKELNDMHALAVALWHSGWLASFESNCSEVERCASDLIELSTRQSFAYWLAGGEVHRGWARSASGDTTEGISWIEKGIDEYRATGSMLLVPHLLALKAEALFVADRTAEALETIREAEALVEKSAERSSSAELHRLRGIFLARIGAEETKIENSFRAAMSTAREQNSVSLVKRAEASYAEYRHEKARSSPIRPWPL